MDRSSNILKVVLLFATLFVLWLPFVQNRFNLKEVKPLEGAVYDPAEDTLTFRRWWSGEYQDQQSKYLNDKFGFRNFSVRLNNQICFSLFKIAKANGVVVGLDNYLYEKPYIDSYYGKDYLGHDSLLRISKQLKFISDTLQKLNKQLIIVFAAGKASYYPEYIPSKYKQEGKPSNYSELSQLFHKQQLHVLDFNKWFIKNKNISKYPLYPKYGIHWSSYASFLVADSIIKVIENLRAVDLPDIEIQNVRMEQPHGNDYDIGAGMNLLQRLQSFPMAYADIKFVTDSSKTKPRLLMISDSFYWSIYSIGFSQAFTNDHFWYYNQLVYPESATEETKTHYLDFDKEIKTHDVFILMATESNLKRFGWGFIDRAYKHFSQVHQTHTADYYQQLKQLYITMQSDPQIMKTISLRAELNHTSEDEELLKLAQVKLEAEKVN